MSNTFKHNLSGNLRILIVFAFCLVKFSGRKILGKFDVSVGNLTFVEAVDAGRIPVERPYPDVRFFSVIQLEVQYDAKVCAQ